MKGRTRVIFDPHDVRERSDVREPAALPSYEEVMRVTADVRRARRLLCTGELDAGAAYAERWQGWIKQYEAYLFTAPRGGVTFRDLSARKTLRCELGEFLGTISLVLLCAQSDEQAAEAVRWAKALLIQDDPTAAQYERIMHDLGGW